MIQMQLNLERRRKRNERKRERWIIKIEKTSCRDVSDSQLSRRLFRDQFHTSRTTNKELFIGGFLYHVNLINDYGLIMLVKPMRKQEAVAFEQ